MYGEHNVIYSLNAIYQKPKRQQALSHAMTAFEFRGVTADFGTENWLGNLFSPSISHLLGLPKLGQPVSTKGKKIKKRCYPVVHASTANTIGLSPNQLRVVACAGASPGHLI